MALEKQQKWPKCVGPLLPRWDLWRKLLIRDFGLAQSLAFAARLASEPMNEDVFLSPLPCDLGFLLMNK